jgi:hypothetical protein
VVFIDTRGNQEPITNCDRSGDQARIVTDVILTLNPESVIPLTVTLSKTKSLPRLRTASEPFDCHSELGSESCQSQARLVPAPAGSESNPQGGTQYTIYLRQSNSSGPGSVGGPLL